MAAPEKRRELSARKTAVKAVLYYLSRESIRGENREPVFTNNTVIQTMRVTGERREFVERMVDELQFHGQLPGGNFTMKLYKWSSNAA